MKNFNLLLLILFIGVLGTTSCVMAPPQTSQTSDQSMDNSQDDEDEDKDKGSPLGN
jgi:hypothetical protein